MGMDGPRGGYKAGAGEKKQGHGPVVMAGQLLAVLSTHSTGSSSGACCLPGPSPRRTDVQPPSWWLAASEAQINAAIKQTL